MARRPIYSHATRSGCMGMQHRSRRFAPNRFPNCNVWLRADHIPLAHGASVSTWPDFSGQNRVIEQTNVNYKPTLQKNVLGNRAAVRFDGTNDFTITNPADSELHSNTTGLTLVCVAQHATAAATDWPMGKYNGGSNWREWAFSAGANAATGGLWISETGAGPQERVMCHPGTDWFIWVATWVPGEKAELRADGVSVGLTTNAINDLDDTAAGTYFGAYRGTSSCWYGDLAEAIVYDRGLQPWECHVLENHLAWYYGLPLDRSWW